MSVWKSTVAGILDLIAGIKGVTTAFILVALQRCIELGGFGHADGPILAFLRGGFFHVLAIPLFAFGVIAIVGGIFALNRRSWGWALAGGIAAVLASFMWGIPAIIFTALSQGEFAAVKGPGGRPVPQDPPVS